MESLWHHTQIFEVLTWSSVWWPHRHLGNPAFSAYWLQTHCSWLAVASIKWMFEEDVYDKLISQSRRMLLVLTPLLLCGFVVIRRWLYLSPLSQNPCLHYSVPQLFWEHCPPLYSLPVDSNLRWCSPTLRLTNLTTLPWSLHHHKELVFCELWL